MKDKPNNCYEISLRLIGTKPKSAEYILGTIYSTKLNQQIQHAWVEHQGKVYDYAEGRRIILPIKEYYTNGKAQIIHRLSREQAFAMAKGTGRIDFWTNEEIKKTIGEKK